MSDDASFFEDDEPIESGPSCRHWQGCGACSEICACGHGCSEHHEAGWCSRCTCLVWVDGPESLVAPRDGSGDDDSWELADLFTDEQEEYDDAAGF